MFDKLKACPFCGGTKIKKNSDDGQFWNTCQQCFADGPPTSKRSDEGAPDWNTRAQLPSQGGEAVEVLTTWHPDSRSYEEQIVSHYTKGSRKALGAMNAKLRVKVGRLERELAAVKQSLTVEPVAYAAFAENGNIRMWCRSAIGMCELFDAHGNKAVPLYTHPADQVADGVVVRRQALELALSNDPMAYLARAELRQLLAKGEGVKK